MAHEIPARLTAADGRKFGLTVGGVFLLFAAISFWRGHTVAPFVMAGLGGTLVLAGIIIPGMLGPVFRGWMAFGLLLSKVTTPIFMGALYFVAITPVSLVMRIMGRTPLRGPKDATTFWVKHESSSGHSMNRQY